MCGRSSLTVTEKELEKKFGSTFYSDELERYNPLPNYNVAPTHMLPVIPLEDPDHFRIFRWGLVPFWAKDLSIGAKMINARVETLTQKPAFKKLLESKRCIVPLDGYYEWIRNGKLRIPYRILLKDKSVFGVAGLHETWKSPSGETVQSFTIITKAPVESVAFIHDRMPAILPPGREFEWLATDLPASNLLDFLYDFPDDAIDFYRVSDLVNKVSNNNPDLLKPFVETDANDQLSLF
jgi:putative SOS response-associated peptidase YedK